MTERHRELLRAAGFSDTEISAMEHRARTATDAVKTLVVAWEFARDTLQDDALDDDTKDLLADELSNQN